MTQSIEGHGRPAPLLGAQFVFNIGFYAVVPFIAVVLSEDFGLAGAAVGLVLGVRTFAQQGMFLIGGVLADRFGARRIILAGCAVRTVGFAGLAAASLPGVSSVTLFILGAVLTGLGGALFSPALNTLLAAAEAVRPVPTWRQRNRPTLFALLAVVGESGAALGPVVGAVLFGWGFPAVAAAGAGLFVVVGIVLARVLPQTAPCTRARPMRAAFGSAGSRGGGVHRWASLRDRRFVLFAGLHSVELLAYNQLYLGMPVELRRVGVSAEHLAVLFVVVSAMTITLQLPLARLARRIGYGRALAAGYWSLVLGFLLLAVQAPIAPVPGWELTAAISTVILLVTGHLLVSPTVLDLVPRLASAQGRTAAPGLAGSSTDTSRPEGTIPLGSYYGLLATFGGVAVLLGNTGIGILYPLSESPAPQAALPWVVLALLPVAAAIWVPRLVRPLDGHSMVPSGQEHPGGASADHRNERSRELPVTADAPRELVSHAPEPGAHQPLTNERKRN